MPTLKKSLFISFAERYSTLVIQFCTTLIVARLLSPKEIGIFSVGAALIGVAHTLRDFGVTNYLIQEKQLSEEKIRSAFTITLIIAWSISTLLLFLRGYIAEFYGEPGVKNVILVLSVNFFLIPFSSVTLALLRREMNFSAIFKISLFSSLIHAAASIILVLFGYGFMSLAWAGLLNVASTLVLAALIHPPFNHIRLSFSKAKEVLSFGGKLSTASLVSEIGTAAPDLFIGKILDFNAVGYFSRANGFVMLVERVITDAIRPVILPFFSSENRSGRNLKQPYLKISNLYLGIAWPLLGFIAVLAYPIIEILFGLQWRASVPIAQVLCVAMVFKSLNFLSASAIVSLGNATAVMRIQLTYQAIRVVAIFFGALQGLIYVAMTLVVAEMLGAIIFFSQGKRLLDIQFSDLSPILLRNGILLLLSVSSTAVIYIGLIVPPDGLINVHHIKESMSLFITVLHSPSLFDEYNPLITTSICVVSFVPLWLVFIFTLKHDLRIEVSKSLNFILNRIRPIRLNH